MATTIPTAGGGAIVILPGDASSGGGAAASSAAPTLQILPLGSGGEVGRSCIVVSFRNKHVMLDCGVHPAKSGLDCLPVFDAINCADIDLCLVTHFHLDHCGALPYFCEQTGFEGRVYMTHPTKKFYRLVMNDFLRIGEGAGDVVTPEWLHSTAERIQGVEYHQEVVASGIRFTAYNAGHVLGAAMFLVDMGGMKILYTGDYSRYPDRHLLGAELPPVAPDVLIVESTYGIQVHESRQEREEKFTRWVHEIVGRGGRCLIPVFALGRAQELLLILEDYWARHKELQHVPIHYASSLAAKCMQLYKTHASSMNDGVKAQLDESHNPFDLKFVSPLRDLASFDDNGASVVLASPGMLQSGISRDLFERWCGDRLNGCIMAGYCVDGTLAHKVLKRQREIELDDGRVLQVRMESVHTVSFSAHSDAKQTIEFIRMLPDTKHVVLVHGNEDSMNKLKNRLSDEFGAAPRNAVIYGSRNATAITIEASNTRHATLLGSVATRAIKQASAGVVMVPSTQQLGQAAAAAHANTPKQQPPSVDDEVWGDEAAANTAATADGTAEVPAATDFDQPLDAATARGIAGAERPSAVVNGVVLIASDQRMSIVDPQELSDYVDIGVSRVEHATVIPFSFFVPTGEVVRLLSTYFGGTEHLRHLVPAALGSHATDDAAATGFAGDDAAAAAARAGGSTVEVAPDVRVQVRHTSQMTTTLTVVWTAGIFTDMVADVTAVALLQLYPSADDAVTAVLLRGSEPTAAALADHTTVLKQEPSVAGRDMAFRLRCFHKMLMLHFPNVAMDVISGAAQLQTASGRWVEVSDWTRVTPLAGPPAAFSHITNSRGEGADTGAAAVVATPDGKSLADAAVAPLDADSHAHLMQLLRRCYLALNPIPSEADDAECLAWCGCGNPH